MYRLPRSIPVRQTRETSFYDEPFRRMDGWTDGSKIAFVSDRLGKPQIFNMNADGTNVKRLTLNGAYNVPPRWSPNNDRIVYARKGGNGFQIFVINPDGSHDVQLTTRGSNEHPRWSPDGRFIVFSSTRDGGQAIYLMRADGSGQPRVSRGKSVDTHRSGPRPGERRSRLSTMQTGRLVKSGTLTHLPTVPILRP